MKIIKKVSIFVISHLVILMILDLKIELKFLASVFFIYDISISLLLVGPVLKVVRL